MSRSPPSLEALFTAAADLPPEERAAFLDQHCHDQPELRRKLEELLDRDRDATSYFDDLAGAIIAAAPLELESAVQTRLEFGPYKAHQVIGRGGMGVIYQAKRVDGEFDQQVALKLLHVDMESPETHARFLAERQLLARLSHPNIARLLDGGVTTEGRPYFVMELVDGMPIATYCREHALRVEEILRLFLDVVDAVGYLHRNLIVHRDLKPGNIFVDQEGQVKLLDFGIAKILTEERGSETLTRTGLQLLTPEYAAPEQLRSGPITTATDVFALGGVLYELLTGCRPFNRDQLDFNERALRTPTAPSTALRHSTPDDAVARNAAVSWRRLAGDLDTICLKALRPEPEFRYASAEQLGEDIERHLKGLPVRARKNTVYYRASRFLLRHRNAVAVAMILVAMLGFGFAHERGLREDAELARLAANREAARALAVSDFLTELLSSVDPAKAQGHEVTVAEVLGRASERLELEESFAEQPAVESAIRRTIGDTYRSLSRLEESGVHLERAVELEGGINATTPQALRAIESLAALKLQRQEVDEAMLLANRVLEVRLASLGEENPETLNAMNLLANVLWVQGRYDEVEVLDRKTLAIRQRVLGDDHPATLKSMNGLATTLYSTARYSEAAETFQHVLAIQQNTAGDSHPDTLTAANNLAACYLELGRYDEARTILRWTLDGRMRVLGNSNPDTWTSMHNLGLTYALQGKYEEGETLLRQAAAYRSNAPGDKESYLFSRSYLADLVRDQDRYDEAETIYVSTLDDQRTLLGDRAPQTLKTMSGFAELRLRQDRLPEAEELIRQVVPYIEKATAAGHPDRLGSMTILARLRNRQGHFSEALELSNEVLSIAENAAAFDTEHPLVLDAMHEKVIALQGLEQIQAAGDLAAQVYEARVRRLGAEHPRTRDILALQQSQ